MNSVVDPKVLLNENIQWLKEYGMPQSDLDKIVWKWEPEVGKYSYGDSPKALVKIIKDIIEHQNKPSIIATIKNMHRKV